MQSALWRDEPIAIIQVLTLNKGGFSMKLRSIMRVALIAATMLGAMSFPLILTTRAGGQGWKIEIQDLSNQPTAQLFLAPTQQATPINCGDTKQGSIDQSDPTLQSGTHFDLYSFTTQQPNQPFIITFGATNFVGSAEVYFVDPQRQQPVFLQGGYAPPNKQVQHIGVLATPGQYLILVYPLDSAQSLGPYTLKFECKACAPAGGSCAGGASPQNAVQLQYDQSLSCELTANDVQIRDSQNMIHFGKIFTFQAQAGTTRVTVNAQAFTPLIGSLDPNSGTLSNINTSPNNLTFPAGPAFIVITSNEPQKTGTFTVQISKGGGPF
jgi:hypothetical protein